MNVPKTQKELVQLLHEQEKRIEIMRKAIVRLESKLNAAVVLIERSAGNNRRLQERTEVLTVRLQELTARLNG